MARVAKGRSELYVVRAEFDAPLAFVHRWCTDYSPDDPGLEDSTSRRRVLSRSRTQVVYEDLNEGKEGWMWSHWTVTIRPPDRWHGTAVGNYRNWEVDYVLTPLPGDRTRLTLRGLRTPAGLGLRNPPKAELERELGEDWAKFRTALEADYRKSRRTGARRTTRAR